MWTAGSGNWPISVSGAAPEASAAHAGAAAARAKKSAHTSILTCGDIEKPTESRILEEGIDVSADLYKLSHHGGYSSNSREFLDAVDPSFAFFNSLEDSPDDFAAEWADEAVSIAMEHANVHSSRYNGNIIYTARDGVITVRAERNIKRKILIYEAPEGNGLCLTFQQFNDRQDPMETDRMREAAEAAASKSGLIPAIYR